MTDDRRGRVITSAIVVGSLAAFACGVGLQAYADRTLGSRGWELVGVLLWTSPILLVTSVAAKGTRPRSRSKIRRSVIVPLMMALTLTIPGIAMEFTSAYTAGTFLIACSVFLWGLAIGSALTPSLNESA